MPHKNTVYHICAAIDSHIHIRIDSNIVSVFQINSVSPHRAGIRCFQVQLFCVNDRLYIRRHSHRCPIIATSSDIDRLTVKVVS